MDKKKIYVTIVASYKQDLKLDFGNGKGRVVACQTSIPIEEGLYEELPFCPDCDTEIKLGTVCSCKVRGTLVKDIPVMKLKFDAELFDPVCMIMRDAVRTLEEDREEREKKPE